MPNKKKNKEPIFDPSQDVVSNADLDYLPIESDEDFLQQFDKSWESLVEE